MAALILATFSEVHDSGIVETTIAYDFDQIISYADHIVALLLCIMFILFFIGGLLIGHYVMYRMKG